MTDMGMTELPQWTLGDRLRKARESAGLTRQEMAMKLGAKPNTLWNWESDASKPRDVLALVRRWSEATGVPAEWLLGLGVNLRLLADGPSLALVDTTIDRPIQSAFTFHAPLAVLTDH